MATILQFLCSKGGVGKSLASMVAVHILQAMGKVVLLIETDTNNPDVAQAYKQEVATETINLSLRDGWAVLATSLQAHSKKHGAAGWVVINGRAASLEAVQEYSRVFWRASRHLQYRVITLWVINRDYDPVRQLADYLKTVPKGAQHTVHVVRNMYFAADGRFPSYDGSDIRKDLEAGGSTTIDLPVMAERNRALLYDKRWSIRKVLKEGDFGYRMEMEIWVDDVKAGLGPVIDA